MTKRKADAEHTTHPTATVLHLSRDREKSSIPGLVEPRNPPPWHTEDFLKLSSTEVIGWTEAREANGGEKKRGKEPHKSQDAGY